jgi:glucokinase
LAVDFGGTIIKFGLVRGGAILATRSIPAEAHLGLRKRFPAIAAVFAELCREQNLSVAQCGGVGLAFPSIVDCRAGRVISAVKDKFEDAPDVDLHAWGRQEFSLPVRLDNDAHAALLGEWRHGAGQGADNLVMLSFGTGIGCSVIMEGRPVRGRHFQTGLLGAHVVVQPGSRHECFHAGGRGCAEAETGSWALPAVAREQAGFADSALAREKVVSYEAVFRCAAQGDAVAVRVRDRSLELWSATIISLVHLFDPERVILGGGVSRSADVIVPWVQRAVDGRAWVPWGKVAVVRAQYLEEAALLGAAVMFERELDFL